MQILLIVQTTSNVTQFFLSLFFSFSLFGNLEKNVLLLFFSSILSSDLVMSLSVHFSVLSILDNFLSSLFLFNLFLSAAPVPFCFLLGSLFCSCFFFIHFSFCSLFCSLLCSFTYFLISLAFFVFQICYRA